MAKRIIQVDGKAVKVTENSTLQDALKLTGKSSVPSVVIDGEVISRRDYSSRAAPPSGMITNAQDIEKGMFLRKRLIDQDADLIARNFLGAFENNPRREIELDTNTLLVRNFPLPDGYSPDYIDVLIVTIGYPDFPPAGIHVPSSSPQLETIKRYLKGHVIENVSNLSTTYTSKVEELEQYGWRWICYHYKDWTWRLNSRDILEGDCLFKYVENLYAALGGNHND